MHLIAVARRAFLAAIKYELLAGAIVLNVTIAVLAAQIFIERAFHALDAAMLEVSETDHVTKHDAVGINTGRVLFEINAAYILGAQFLAKRVANCFRYLAFQHDITAIAVEFFRNIWSRKLQLAADKIDSRVDIGQMSRISDHRFDRNIVRQDFVIGVENRAALGKNGLLVNVFLSSEPGVLVVLDHLEIDQAKRKRAEEQDETETDDGASGSTVPFH